MWFRFDESAEIVHIFTVLAIVDIIPQSENGASIKRRKSIPSKPLAYGRFLLHIGVSGRRCEVKLVQELLETFEVEPVSWTLRESVMLLKPSKAQVLLQWSGLLCLASNSFSSRELSHEAAPFSARGGVRGAVLFLSFLNSFIERCTFCCTEQHFSMVWVKLSILASSDSGTSTVMDEAGGGRGIAGTAGATGGCSGLWPSPENPAWRRGSGRLLNLDSGCNFRSISACSCSNSVSSAQSRLGSLDRCCIRSSIWSLVR